MDDSWFARLAALTGLVGRVSAMIGVLMVAAVFLVIGNSVRLSIFARRDSINVQKLDWCDGWFHPASVPVRWRIAGIFWRIVVTNFVRNSGAAFVIGGCGSGTGFGTKFDINGLSFDECLLLLLVCSMIGWVAAWLATVQHLRHFTPE